MDKRRTSCFFKEDRCKLHASGHYSNWSCDENGYSPTKRKKMFEARKSPCGKCGELKSPDSKLCFRCAPHKFKYEGKRLPLKWKKNILKNNPWTWKGEKNPAWIGNSVDYSALHHWIRRIRGHAKNCSKCGLIGKKNGRAWNIQWANKSNLYKREVDDWIALCPKCHASFQKETGKSPVTIWTGRDVHLVSSIWQEKDTS